jgi:hypothetical protein
MNHDGKHVFFLEPASVSSPCLGLSRMGPKAPLFCLAKKPEVLDKPRQGDNDIFRFKKKK